MSSTASKSGSADLHRLIAASERMASARSFDAVFEILHETARAVAGADGIAVILREGGHALPCGELYFGMGDDPSRNRNGQRCQA